MVVDWKKHTLSQQQVLYAVDWHRVVLDEAHDVRDSRSKAAKAVYALRAARRWAVTGTPVQNCLDDMAGLYQFLRVYPYDEPRTFRNQIKSLCHLTHRSEAVDRLKRLIQSVMLRRSISHITLPTRKNLVCKLDFSSEERQLYEDAKQDSLVCMDGAFDDESSVFNALQALTRLRLLCNLGALYHGNRNNSQHHSTGTATPQQFNAQESYNAMVMAGSATCYACNADVGTNTAEVADQPTDSEAQPCLFSCMRLLCWSCQEQAIGRHLTCGHSPTHEYRSACTLSSGAPSTPLAQISVDEMPTKVQALLCDLEQHSWQEKCIVFSFWTSTLDVVERGLQQLDIPFIRFDGNLRARDKAKVLEAFAEDDAIRVALLTISCGAVGIDLTAASRAYLMEPHWNPSVEEQALARIYRMGQQRPVTTIRYIMHNTLEEHVLKVQERKTLLAQTLLSEDHESSAAGGSMGLTRLEQLRNLLRD